jgi:hypothetical protein
MPQGAPVGTKGLNDWVMAVSGELSMTRVFPVALVFAELELALELEHAASPAASNPAAPTTKSRLWLRNLLITLVFLSFWLG